MTTGAELILDINTTIDPLHNSHHDSIRLYLSRRLHIDHAHEPKQVQHADHSKHTFLVGELV